jgi:hypothetical protein
MARGITAEVQAALASDGFRLATLIELGFDTPVRVTDYGASLLAFVDKTFSATSSILEIGSASESGALQVNSMALTFSGVDQAYISLFLSNDYIDVQAKLWRAVIDEEGLVVEDPFLYFDGRIVGYAIEDTGATATIEIEVASHWKDFEKVNNRKTNSNSQALYFPGDKGFDFASKQINEIKWGRA